MKIPSSLILLGALTLILAGCGESNNQPAANQTSAVQDAAGAMGRSANRALDKIDTAALNEAAQTFNAQEGHYPKDLNELLQSKLIHEIPPAPTGMKLSYDPNTGITKIVPQ